MKGKELNREETLKMLESSYDMYRTTREETIERRNNKVDKDGNRIYSEGSLEATLELLDTMLDDIVMQYAKAGGNPDDLKNRKVKKRNNKKITEAVERISAEDGMSEYKKGMIDEAKRRERNKYSEDVKPEEPVSEENPVETPVRNENESQRDINRRILERIGNDNKENPENVVNVPPKNAENVRNFTRSYENIPKIEEVTEKKPDIPNGSLQKASFDEVSLPSRGECYKSKIDKIRVSHLVAYDENLILSPGLYRNGTFLDHILKNKILDNIDPDSLIQGDRDAIIIWLRAGGYGPMYPIRMTDEESGKEFETNVDLSALEFKKFTLKGDENGYFDFVLPNSGDIVKFKFLTAGDAKKLEKMRKEESEAEDATDAREKIRDIVDFITKSDKITGKESDAMTADLHDIEDVIYSRYKDAGETYYTHDLTNRLVLSTISVNGISDREFVTNYILNMNLKDAAEYRKYIIDNEPGIDYNIKVKRPDSLGGGYIDTFLQLDQFIFIY